jgi:predicted transglutaminase-like cysteine proteinase
VFWSGIGAFCAAVSIALFSSAPADAARSRGPTVFGTVVLPTSSTPYDSRWSRAQSRDLGAGARIAASARRLDGLDRLRFVNAAVNRAIAYREDRSHGRTADFWASPAQTFRRGSGDCEDFAIAKMQVLRASGIPAANLFLVIGNDLAARSAHALLVVRSGGKFWVLDNLSNQVRGDAQYREFRPVITLSNSGSWLHGYKVGAVG